MHFERVALGDVKSISGVQAHTVGRTVTPAPRTQAPSAEPRAADPARPRNPEGLAVFTARI